jgi:PsbP-like protein
MLRKQKAWIIVSQITISITSLFVLSSTQGQQQFEIHDDPLLGISIEYPHGWDVKTEPDAVSFQPLNLNNSEFVIFGVESEDLSPEATTAEQYMRQKMNEQREYDLDLIELNQTTVSGGNFAYKIVYTQLDGEMKSMDYYTIEGDRGYALTFAVVPWNDFETYLPLANRIVDSFRILD